MLTHKFGMELECTGITRYRAAQVAAELLGGTVDGERVIAPDGRVWKFVYDGSIVCQRKINGQLVAADSDYSVEMVSPILTYREDIDTLQELIRRLRRAGAFAGKTEGIHLHLDGAGHTARSIRNFINIIASKNDLLYKALQIAPERMECCKKIDAGLVERMNRAKPKSLAEIEDIWYENWPQNRTNHYHRSRYTFLNLHSFFSGHGTIELRGFNASGLCGSKMSLHAGVVRSYILLALAMNHQALTQKSASPKKVQAANEKFAMRTYLTRIGFIGDEFKNCREHLCRHLSGNAAWRYRAG